MVCPSGSVFATAPTPSVPPAPARFSTTNGWPSCSDRRWVTVRAMMSVELPAVNGTTTVTRLVGHDCASAASEAMHAANAATHFHDRLMTSLFESARASFAQLLPQAQLLGLLHGHLILRFERALEPNRVEIRPFSTQRFSFYYERRVRGERFDRLVPPADDVGRELRWSNDPVPSDERERVKTRLLRGGRVGQLLDARRRADGQRLERLAGKQRTHLGQILRGKVGAAGGNRFEQGGPALQRDAAKRLNIYSVAPEQQR